MRFLVTSDMLQPNTGPVVRRWNGDGVAVLLLVATLAASSSAPLLAQEKAKADRDGAPLPTGALARLGDAVAGGRRIAALTISADGKTLLSRGSDRVIQCWDLATGDQRSRLRLPRWAEVAALAPDGRTVACAANYHVVAVIERHEVGGKLLQELQGNADGIDALFFSPDGKLLASTGTDDNTIYLHDLAGNSAARQIVMRPENSATVGVFRAFLRRAAVGIHCGQPYPRGAVYRRAA